MKELKFISPFKKLCITIGNLPTAYIESMSYYEGLTFLVNYLANNVIPAVNNNSEVVKELQDQFVILKDYVDNYFENLDVQEEINNKLDEMADSGQLTDIIAQYLGLAGMITFNTVAEMKAAENLVDGSKCQTLGYYNVNDSGNSIYKVREIINTDVIDEATLIALHDVNLVAELVTANNTVNVKQLGAVGDGVEDDSVYFRKAIGKYKNVEVPIGEYYFDTSVVLTGNDINFYGVPAISPNVLADERSKIICTNDYAFTIGWGNVNNFSYLSFSGYGLNEPTSSVIENCMFQGKTGLRKARMEQIDKCMFRDMEIGIDEMTDTVVTNCVFNPCSVKAINLVNSNDNRILNNRITWNELGIYARSSNYNNISNNIFDRNTTYGIDIESSSLNVISNNIFERNLENHIKGKLYYCNINGNVFMAKNSLDDQTGVVVPTSAFDTANIKGCTFTGNAMNNMSKMFKNSVAWEDNSFSGNTFNYIPLEGQLVELGTITIPANTESLFSKSWSGFGYLGVRPFDMDISYIVARYGSPKDNLYQGDQRITKFYVNNNSGIYCRINNDTASSIEYTIYAKISVNNPRYVEVTL